MLVEHVCGRFGAIMSCCLRALFVSRCRHYVEPAYVDLHNERLHAGRRDWRCCCLCKTKTRNTRCPGFLWFIRMRSLLITWEAICLSGSVFWRMPLSNLGIPPVCVRRLAPVCLQGRSGPFWTRARRVMPISPARSPCGAAVSRSSGRPGSRCRTTRSCRASKRCGRRPASPPDVRASVRAWRPP